MREDNEFVLKFRDCETCQYLFRSSICRECDSGEFYEEADMPGIDSIIKD